MKIQQTNNFKDSSLLVKSEGWMMLLKESNIEAFESYNLLTSVQEIVIRTTKPDTNMIVQFDKDGNFLKMFNSIGCESAYNTLLGAVLYNVISSVRQYSLDITLTHGTEPMDIVKH